MRHLFLSIIFAILPTLVIAQQYQETLPLPIQSCQSQVPFGIPTVKLRESTKICRHGYILEHDDYAKIPKWVSYVLTPDHALGCLPRTNNFEPDLSIPVGKRSGRIDYAKSGYDIGHIANAADMEWSYETINESFILSNMAPQLPGFNRGIWKHLEETIRVWAVERKHPILIYSGSIYNNQSKVIGPDLVVVPDMFYKVVIDMETHEAMSFEFAHQPSTLELSAFLTNINKIEADSGTILPLPADIKFTNMWQQHSSSISLAKHGVCSK